jgi:hypothetical protein
MSLARDNPPDPLSTTGVDRVVDTSATSTCVAAAIALFAPAVKDAPAGGAAAPRLRRTAFRRGRGVVFSDCSVPGSFTMMSIAIALPNGGSDD